MTVKRQFFEGVWGFVAPALVLVAVFGVIVALKRAALGRESMPVNVPAVTIGYAPDPDNEAVDYRGPLDGGEAFTNVVGLTGSPSTAAAVTTITCGGFANVTVWTSHSTASSTVVLRAVRYRLTGDANVWEEGGTTQFTLTGDATFTRDGTRFLSTSTYALDTAGFGVMKIYAADPSVGNVTIYYKRH